jgi:hypothetical protein
MRNQHNFTVIESAQMKNDIQNAVGVLVGMPLWSLGRAADLAWFEFGSRRTVKDWKGKKKKSGTMRCMSSVRGASHWATR